jgi:hypothetical protein
VKPNHPQLIIIDTVTPTGKNQNYYEADYESVKSWRLAEYDIAIVVVHRKPEADDPFNMVSLFTDPGASATLQALRRPLAAQGDERRARAPHIPT